MSTTPPSVRYLLDTNILVHYARGNALARHLEEQFQFQTTTTSPLICEVSVGEVYAFALHMGWAEKKVKQLKRLLDLCVVVPLNFEGVYRAYADIDYFSQKPGPGHSSRNMGKNDLWIAAAAHVTGTTLLSTDRDFEHLSPRWIELIYVDPTAL